MTWFRTSTQRLVAKSPSRTASTPCPVNFRLCLETNTNIILGYVGGSKNQDPFAITTLVHLGIFWVFLGVMIIRIVIYLGVFWVPHIYGSSHISAGTVAILGIWDRKNIGNHSGPYGRATESIHVAISARSSPAVQVCDIVTDFSAAHIVGLHDITLYCI